MITALAGGIGASKFLSGLVRVVDSKDLTVIVNTGDDIDFHGMHVSPDVDIVCYTLAGIVSQERGWGINEDTFHFLDALKKFGVETWFNIGDRDLATHVYRTLRLNQGLTLSQVTTEICCAINLGVHVLPMSNDKFETIIKTPQGAMHFEEYLVKNAAEPKVLGVEFPNAKNAKPSPGVLEAIENSDLVIVCPSNPVVSIGPILAVKGVRDALRRSAACRVAVSPIIAGAPIKGPADKLLGGLGLEVCAFSVAQLYADFLDLFVVDVSDADQKQRIEELGVEVRAASILMNCLEDKVGLARTVLNYFPDLFT
ncbi:MAG: 2-phospho-L-lactate transferase [Candidatus Bathyarchaeota archaeon]|nr:2-phospho-L-lactate transferase [Candidatus Bathyarchaeota archaeon]